jgi:hypothetical protein
MSISKKFPATVVFAGVAFTLSGCGGGSSTPVAAPASAEAPIPLATDVPAPTFAAAPVVPTPTSTKAPTYVPQSGAGSAGSGPVVMPDVVGLGLSLALDALTNAGLTNSSVCSTPGGAVPLMFSHWRVVEQSVSAGSRVNPDAAVCLAAIKKDDL